MQHGAHRRQAGKLCRRDFEMPRRIGRHVGKPVIGEPALHARSGGVGDDTADLAAAVAVRMRHHRAVDGLAERRDIGTCHVGRLL